MNRHPMAGGLPSDVDSSLHGSTRSEPDSRNCFGFYEKRASRAGFTLRTCFRQRLGGSTWHTQRQIRACRDFQICQQMLHASCGARDPHHTGTTQGEEPPWDATPGSSSPRWPPPSSPPSVSSRPRRPPRPTQAGPRRRASRASTAADHPLPSPGWLGDYCRFTLTRTISRSSTRASAERSARTLARDRRPDEAAALR